MNKVVSILMVICFVSTAFAKDVIPLMQNDPAPYSGLLVDETKFSKYLKLEINLKSVKEQLEIQKHLNISIENLYIKRMEEMAQTKWYQSAEFNRWLGFFGGLIVAGAVVYLAR